MGSRLSGRVGSVPGRCATGVDRERRELVSFVQAYAQ